MLAGQVRTKLRGFVRSLLLDEIVTYRISKRLASHWRERISVTIFLSQLILVRALVLCRVLPRDMDQADAWVRVRGIRFCVGLRTQEIAMCDEVYRDQIYEKVRDFVPDVGWTVFDVGAHVGVFTIQQAARGARVFAFEPNPDCYRRMVKTAAANRLRGTVHASNYAVGAAPGRGMLNLPSAGRRRPFGGTVVPSNDTCVTPGLNDVSMIPVTITSLDVIVPALGITHIDLLNIYKDEVEVLHGAAQTLNRTERVMVEYRSVRDRADIEKLLLAAGFTMQLDDVDANGFGILHMQRPISHAV